MVRIIRRLALAAAIVLAASLALPIATPSASADTPIASTAVRLAFEEPQESEGQFSVSVLLTTAAGEPVSQQPVDFSVRPDFFGERSMPLRTALTDSDGRATITYAPTWEGEHDLTAQFPGDEEYGAGEASLVMTVAELPAVELAGRDSLDAVRQWAAPGAIAISVAVWLLLGWVMVRVIRGVSQAGRRAEQPRPAALSETAMGRLPDGRYR